MKQHVLSSIFILVTFLTNAQIGIGTTSPDPSSILEVQSTTKGFLAPRINLSSVTNSSIDGANTNAAGLLIYNTNASVTGGNGVGYYYWDGSIWVSMNATPSDQEWKLDGNSVAATAFLGTTNAQNLRIRTNNTERFNFSTEGQLLYTDGGIEIGTGTTAASSNIAVGNNSNASATNTTAVGTTALASQENALSIGTGSKAQDFRGIAIGNLSNAVDDDVIAIGSSATANTVNGIAIGAKAETTGVDAIAIGANSKTTAEYGLAFGREATSVARGLALGFKAKAQALNTVAIGQEATATQENSIILGNHNNADVRVGIGTNTPSAKLQVNTSFKYVDGNEGEGKVLTSDAEGNASWETPESSGSTANKEIQILADNYDQNGPYSTGTYVLDLDAYPSTKSVFIYRKTNSTFSRVRLRGIKGGTDGRTVTLMKLTDQFEFLVLNNDGAVSAENRFNIRSNYQPSQERYISITFIYDGSTERWVLLNRVDY